MTSRIEFKISLFLSYSATKNKKNDKREWNFADFNTFVESTTTKISRKEVLFPKIAQKTVFSTLFL